MSAHDDTAELLAFAALDDNKRLIAERDRLRVVNAELIGAVKGLLGLVRRTQEKLCAHLHPDSSGDDGELLNTLLYDFDGPEQREIEGTADTAVAKAAAGAA